MWQDNGDEIPHGRCHTHRAPYCRELGHDQELSTCANLIADEMDLRRGQRAMINQFNIERVLGLPVQYGKREPTNHISDNRMKEARDERKKKNKKQKYDDLDRKYEPPKSNHFIDLISDEEKATSIDLDIFDFDDLEPRPLKRLRYSDDL